MEIQNFFKLYIMENVKYINIERSPHPALAVTCSAEPASPPAPRRSVWLRVSQTPLHVSHKVFIYVSEK